MSFWGNNETIEQTDSGLVVKNIREDAPEWKRGYEKRLDNRAFIKITARNFIGSRWFDGTLTQPNGNSISFDPRRIADKIIDPLLVPLVQECVDEIFTIDKAYIKTDPDQFIDVTDEIINPAKWTESDYDLAARALIEAERKIARMETSKGGKKYKNEYGAYKPFTDAEWAQAKTHPITATARKDAYVALNAVGRVPEGYTLVRTQ